jgi:hypothetical protein
VSFEDEDREELEQQWRQFAIDVPLEIVYSPYRELIQPVLRYIDELDDRWDNDTITVVIPEFVVGKWYEHLLHNQSALFLKGKLLFREGTVVTSVPYHVPAGQHDQLPAGDADNGEAATADAGGGGTIQADGEVVSHPLPQPDPPGDTPHPVP